MKQVVTLHGKGGRSVHNFRGGVNGEREEGGETAIGKRGTGRGGKRDGKRDGKRARKSASPTCLGHLPSC